MNAVRHLAGKTIFITGASRGIGKEIGLRCAKDGANIVIAAKTATAHAKLPGTIYTAAKEIEEAGGQCLPCVVDVRNEEQVKAAVEAAVAKFGGIDILINNASAISITGTLDTTMKSYDLMNQVNARGTFLCSKVCLPYLKMSDNGHILNMSPPLHMDSKWFKSHTAYTMAKYGMSMCSLGMSEEFRKDKVAVNTLWPRTAILTAAMEMLGGPGVRNQCRKPDIMADAAYAIITKPSSEFTGQFCVDERVLRNDGVTDFLQYQYVKDAQLIVDLYVNNDIEFPLEEEKINNKSIYGSNDDGGIGKMAVSGLMDVMRSQLNAQTVEYVGANIVLDVKDEGKFVLHLKSGDGKVEIMTDEDKDIDTTISLSADTLKQLIIGKTSSTQAYMEGSMIISGSMGKAMKLESLFSSMKPKL